MPSNHHVSVKIPLWFTKVPSEETKVQIKNALVNYIIKNKL
jgi:hypothetical protein